MNFENRNKDLTNIHKAADYLSRSLRENLKVFSVDSANGRVTFLSERNTALHCDYEILKGSAHLTNFIVEPIEEFLSEGRINDRVSGSITDFVKSLRENRYDTADTSFDDVIHLFEERSNLSSLERKVTRQMDSFGDKTKIVNSSEYTKLMDIKEIMVSFISDNKDSVMGNKEIHNSLRIGNALRSAFNAPVTSYEELVEGARFSVDLCGESSLYEMICKQELVRQELLEAKENFSKVWISNDAIQNLASCIYSKDEPLKESLKEIIEEVPYFAFSTKSDLSEIFTSVFEVNSTDVVSKKDVKEFIKKLYEWKKPAKEAITNLLDEKYGINVANLKFVPTFSNLARTQSVMFEVLSMLADDNSVVQDISKEFSKFVAGKGGVETLELNDFIVEIFEEATEEKLEENLLMQYIDMPRLSRDISALRTLIVGDEAPMGSEMGGEGMEEEVPEEGVEDEGVPDEEGIDADGLNGEEVPEQGMEDEEVPGEEVEAEEGQDMPVGDDSNGDIPTDEEDPGMQGGMQGGGGGEKSKLASDLDALVQSLGLGNGNGEEDEEDEDDDSQYEA